MYWITSNIMTISLIKTSAAQNNLKNIIFLHSHILCSFFLDFISFHLFFIWHQLMTIRVYCVFIISNFFFFIVLLNSILCVCLLNGRRASWNESITLHRNSLFDEIGAHGPWPWLCFKSASHISLIRQMQNVNFNSIFIQISWITISLQIYQSKLNFIRLM